MTMNRRSFLLTAGTVSGARTETTSPIKSDCLCIP
jgi:hypothetical protein